MQRIGGMITAPLLSMFVVPVVYLLIRRRQLGKDGVLGVDILFGIDLAPVDRSW